MGLSARRADFVTDLISLLVQSSEAAEKWREWRSKLKKDKSSAAQRNVRRENGRKWEKKRRSPDANEEEQALERINDLGTREGTFAKKPRAHFSARKKSLQSRRGHVHA
ncbi:uncharacterized protein A4U43_C01F8040 [Asparagus officinalis]|uniref:Uncharacterized protein n=1 Tax=Asparagus officinalis TaxID=4686 RepID=A0A5P1FNB5_ASPOF|nr:uncharacterized protein A4U43_C01F8040 [Asparagus officinalis]